MNKQAHDELTEYPYTKTSKCKACGSDDWANAKLSPKDLAPLECDRCPPKKKDIAIPHAEQRGL